MNTRPTPLTAALIAGLVAVSSAHAGPRGDGDGFVTQARVLSSTPIYETINEPRRECWTETVGYERTTARDGNNTGGAILGALAGGLIGSTVGKGNGKVAAAAVGAATGAVVGDRWNDGAGRYESRPRQVERCQVQNNYRDVITGYDVRYRFQDREYTTRLPYDPGKWLTLNVSFRVAENQRDGWKSSRNDWYD
ncbi:MAG: glycine zipper 2TM domain-containing protein [Thiobacillus sp.]